jgi:hypothetical protein
MPVVISLHPHLFASVELHEFNTGPETAVIVKYGTLSLLPRDTSFLNVT